MHVPYVFLVLAGLTLVTAMWQSLRRPPLALSRPCVRWHVIRIVLLASTASLGAGCVLVAVQQMS